MFRWNKLRNYQDKLKELAKIVENKNAEELISFIKAIHSKGKLLL